MRWARGLQQAIQSWRRNCWGTARTSGGLCAKWEKNLRAFLLHAHPKQGKQADVLSADFHGDHWLQSKKTMRPSSRNVPKNRKEVERREVRRGRELCEWACECKWVSLWACACVGESGQECECLRCVWEYERVSEREGVCVCRCVREREERKVKKLNLEQSLQDFNQKCHSCFCFCFWFLVFGFWFFFFFLLWQ